MWGLFPSWCGVVEGGSFGGSPEQLLLGLCLHCSHLTRTSGSAVSLGLFSQDIFFGTTLFLTPAPQFCFTSQHGHDGFLSHDNSLMYHPNGWLQPDPCFLSNYGGHEYQAHFTW